MANEIKLADGKTYKVDPSWLSAMEAKEAQLKSFSSDNYLADAAANVLACILPDSPDMTIQKVASLLPKGAEAKEIFKVCAAALKENLST